MNFNKKRLSLILICLFVGSCANKPAKYSEKDIQLDLPEEWKVSGEQLSINKEGWSNHLAAVQVQKQIDLTLKNNPDLRSLSANIKGQQLLANIAKRNKFPDARLQLNANKNEVLRGDSADSEQLQLQFISDWEVDVWGRLSSSEKSALWSQQAAVEDFQFAKLSLVGQVVQLWLEAIEQQQLISLNQQETESWLLSLEILESDYQAGVAAKTAVHLAQTQLALAKANYHQLVQVRDNTIRQMLTIQGRFPDVSLVALPSSLPKVPQLKLDNLSMGALGQRPDVKAAMANLESLDAAASSAYKALYPQLKLTLTPSLLTDNLSSVGSANRLLNSTLSILQPIFSRNSVLLTARVAETKSEQSYWTYVQTVLNASKEVMQGVNDHKNLLNREKQLVLAKQEAYLASESANEDYEQGVGTVLDWLSLKRSFLTIEQQVVRNRASALKNWVSVHVALASPINNIN